MNGIGFKFDPFARGGLSAPDPAENGDGSLNLEHLELISKIFANSSFQKEVEYSIFQIWQHANNENYDKCMLAVENIRAFYNRFDELNNEFQKYIEAKNKGEEYIKEAEQKLDTI